MGVSMYDVNMHENVLQVGPLIGVMTESGNSGRQDTAFLLLNSGIMHRVGPCRLSVRLARSIAAEVGLPCLRFDFSGVGDSATRRVGGLTFEQAAVHEVVEVMDHLSNNRGINKFILYGLCSGARIAGSTAEADDRVIALVQVDGICYPTRRSRVSYYISRLHSLDGWRARISRWLRLGKVVEDNRLVLAGTKKDFEIPEFSHDPGHDQVTEQLKLLMNRGVRLHCVFTGREPDFFYRGQYSDCFSTVDFGANLSVDYYPDASHIFNEPTYQQRMVAGVVDWLSGVMDSVNNSSDIGRGNTIAVGVTEQYNSAAVTWNQVERTDGKSARLSASAPGPGSG